MGIPGKSKISWVVMENLEFQVVLENMEFHEHSCMIWNFMGNLEKTRG